MKGCKEELENVVSDASGGGYEVVFPRSREGGCWRSGAAPAHDTEGMAAAQLWGQWSSCTLQWVEALNPHVWLHGDSFAPEPEEGELPWPLPLALPSDMECWRPTGWVSLSTAAAGPGVRANLGTTVTH